MAWGLRIADFRDQYASGRHRPRLSPPQTDPLWRQFQPRLSRRQAGALRPWADRATGAAGHKRLYGLPLTGRRRALFRKICRRPASLLQPSEMVSGQIVRSGVTCEFLGYYREPDRRPGWRRPHRRPRSHDPRLLVLAGRSGVWNPEAFQFARSMGTINLNQTLGAVEVGGRWESDKLKLVFSGSDSGGTRGDRTVIRSATIATECVFPLNATGLELGFQRSAVPHASMPAFAEFVGGMVGALRSAVLQPLARQADRRPLRVQGGRDL